MKQKLYIVRLLTTAFVGIAPLFSLTSVTRADVQNFYTPSPSPSPSSSPRPDPRHDYTPGTDRNSHAGSVSLCGLSLQNALIVSGANSHTPPYTADQWFYDQLRATRINAGFPPI